MDVFDLGYTLESNGKPTMPINTQNARVTIVMTVRERHGLTIPVLNALLQHTTQPYRLIYADVQSPNWLQAYLAASSEQWGFEWLRFEQPLWPQQIRSKLADLIDTEYVLYIDNDILVQPGWLDHLVNCADETRAGIVGPLYLWGDGRSVPRVHMAGGQLTKSFSAEGMVLEEMHHDLDADPEKIADKLVRKPCDFAEYHCMLVRTELVRHPSVLDETIYCVHEHIDTALSVVQRGYPVYLEPAARVVYLAFAEYSLEDLVLFRSRWRIADAEASIRAFAQKWKVVDDHRSFDGIRIFLQQHTGGVDPLRPLTPRSPDRNVPICRETLKQTRSDLFDVAIEQGYSAKELEMLAFSYHIAHVLMDGGYRPCGRPFINHLVGTASVLMHFGFRMEVVAAGLLHSVYSHSPAHVAGPKPLVDGLCTMLGGEGSVLERRVRAYEKRALRWREWAAQPESFLKLTVLDAETIAIAVANEIDMHLSGEFRYSGRADEMDATMSPFISHVCQRLEVPGLYLSLATAAVQKFPVVPTAFMTELPSSYRIAGDKINLIRMAVNKISALL